MKSLILVLTLLLSTSAFARQYIQCATQGSDVAVVNLLTEQSGTLFLSSGMENPDDERLLVNIELEKVKQGFHTYKVINENGEGSVHVPSSIINKSANNVKVDLTFSEYSFSYLCFSRIYND